MRLGDRIRGWLEPAAEGARRRPRSQARPLSADPYEPQPFRRAHWVGLGAAALAAIVLTGSLVFIILNLTRPGEPRAATPTPALPVAASPSPVGLAEIFATATPTTPPVGTAQTFGERAQIANTGGEGANLRREPSTTAERLRLLPEGTLVEIVGPDRDADARRWRNVRDSDGESGWVQSSFLAAEGSVTPVRPAAAPATPASTRPPAAAQVAPTSAAEPARPTPTRAAAPAATKPASPRAQIANTGGQGANVRSEPGAGGRVLKTLAEGSAVEVLGAEREVEGRPWRQIRDSAGVTGWIVSGALVGAGSLPTPVPPGARTAT
ncbi:MAG: SH3 domain-containing protein, partial [Chloroflexi bacterium]|nr:SH3 domain-containing protein [Chloroflexota bacterium]